MTEISYQFPLNWPKSWAKTPQNHRTYNNGFKPNMTLDEALDFLDQEIQAIKPENASLSSEIEHIRNPRLRKRIGNESGVCLQIGFGTQRFMLPCDRWYMVEHNIYAIYLALQHFRQVEKYGLGSLPFILTGYAPGSIQAHAVKQHEEISGSTLASWQQALGLGPTATLEDANATYRRRAKDKKDDQTALTELNLAMEDARKHFGG